MNLPIDYIEHTFNFNNGFYFEYKSQQLPDFLNNFKQFFMILGSKTFVANEPFYSVNYPKEIEGYIIVELSEDIYEYKKSYMPQNINDYFDNHRTHYLKWKINEDLSIRYFFIFEDIPAFERKYFIKSHSKKEYIPLSKKQAQIMIDKLECLEPEEIIGMLNQDYTYQKIIQDSEGKVKIIKEKD